MDHAFQALTPERLEQIIESTKLEGINRVLIVSSSEDYDRLIIQLLTDFLAYAAPSFRGRFHRLRIDHLFDHGKIFRQPRPTLVRG